LNPFCAALAARTVPAIDLMSAFTAESVSYPWDYL